MKKDITLVNSASDPVICRVVSFRNDLLNKFFDEIVYKHNEKCKLSQIIFSVRKSQLDKVTQNCPQLEPKRTQSQSKANYRIIKEKSER